MIFEFVTPAPTLPPPQLVENPDIWEWFGNIFSSLDVWFNNLGIGIQNSITELTNWYRFAQEGVETLFSFFGDILGGKLFDYFGWFMPAVLGVHALIVIIAMVVLRIFHGSSGG